MAIKLIFFSHKLGANLRACRENLSISQSELARMCLKDRQYIHKIKVGELTPTINNVYLICKELEIDVNQLLNF